MSEQVFVIGVFAISYGAIFGYSVYLHLRRSRVKD